MATFTVGPNSKLFWGGYDLSGTVKEGSMSIDVDALETTAWGASNRTYRPGLVGVSISGSGYQEHGAGMVGTLVSDAVENESNIVIAAGGNASAEGDILYVCDSMVSSYVPIQGAVGDIGMYAFAAQGFGNWFRGKLMSPTSTQTSSDTTTGLQLGTIAASKNMFASLHVFSASGTSPTLDVTIESDDNSGFSSATTRMTFAQADDVGVQLIGPTAGPGGSDDYWRVAWTIGGSDTPTFSFAVIFGHDLNG